MGKSPFWFHLLFLVIFSGTTSHGLLAQESLPDKRIILESRTAAIRDILSDIATAGDFSFGYGPIIPADRLIWLEGGTKKISEFLDEILEGIPAVYVYIERTNKILIYQGPSVQSIRGRISDLESGRTLAGANIRIPGATPELFAVSDTNGIFHLKGVPIGRCNIVISYLGFQTYELYDELVQSGKELYLMVSMQELFIELSEATVEYGNRKGDPLNDMATVSARSFTIEEAGRYPAALNDPARLALVFPGVTPGDEDLFNEMVIRGNSPHSTVWRIEGVEVLVPNHFAIEKSTTGWINIINSSLLGKSDFLTGAFPAEYGNALGGVFDINLRKGNNGKNEYSFEFGSLGVGLSAEGPFSKDYGGSYLVNARYSTTQVQTRLVESFEEAIDPRYWDICYKLHFPTRKFGSFSLWGLGGAGKASNDRSDNADTLGESTSSRMTALGLTHLWYPNDKSYLKSIISFSMNKTTYDQDSLISFKNIEGQDFSLGVARASIAYRYKFNRKLSVKLGGTFSHMIFSYFQFGPFPGRIDSEGTTNMFQGYLQGKYYLAQNLILNAGFHYLHFALNQTSSLEPRLGLRWNISEEQSIGMGIGLHSQHDYVSSYFHEKQGADGNYYMLNRNLGLSKAMHYVLSYQNSLIKNTSIKAEIYYQDLFDVPVKYRPVYIKAPVNNEYPMDSLLNIGKGRNYGIEMIIEKNFSRGYYFLLAASFYDSKIDPGNDTLYNTRYNANMAHKLVGGREFEVGRNKQNLLGVNGKIIWTGGNRGQLYENDIALLAARYEQQFAPYYRLDINCTYRLNRPRATHSFSFDVQNITNRYNVVRKNLDFASGLYEVDYQYGIFPFLSYKVEF